MVSTKHNAILVALIIGITFITGIATGISIYQAQEPEYYGMYVRTYSNGSWVNGAGSLTLHFTLGAYPVTLYHSSYSDPWGSLGTTDGSYHNIPENTRVDVDIFLVINGTLLNTTFMAMSYSHHYHFNGTLYLNGDDYIFSDDSPFGEVGFEIRTALMGSETWNGGRKS